jgi:hypothetical protein
MRSSKRFSGLSRPTAPMMRRPGAAAPHPQRRERRLGAATEALLVDAVEDQRAPRRRDAERANCLVQVWRDRDDMVVTTRHQRSMA